MKEIEVKILNPSVIADAENMMVAMARLTQKGHTIQSMSDLEALLAKPYKVSTAKTMLELPHPTIKQFATINVAIVGLSRRALAQITRRRVGVTFMSSSLQYSDYTDSAQVVVPYELTKLDYEGEMYIKHGVANWYTKEYIKTCKQAILDYETAIKYGVPHDAAGYMMPQGLRGVLIISGTPQTFIEMCSQRTCNRNTLETQYIMLRIWEMLHAISIMFENSGPTCMTKGICQEGNMFCGEFPVYTSPTHWLDDKFKYIRGRNK